MQQNELNLERSFQNSFKNAHTYYKNINNITLQTQKEIINIIDRNEELIHDLTCKFIKENYKLIPHDQTIQEYYYNIKKNIETISNLKEYIMKVKNK